MNELSLKLSRANGMLSKIRHFVSYETLVIIYHAIFGSHLRYGCQIWALVNLGSHKKISSLQNRAMRIMHFQPSTSSSNILYYLSKTLKIVDLIRILNCVLVWDQQHSKLPVTFNSFFLLKLKNTIITT